MSITISDATRDFIDDLAGLGRATATTAAYDADLRQLMAYIAEHHKGTKTVDQLTDEMLLGYARQIRVGKDNTAARKGTAIRQFLLWLRRREHGISEELGRKIEWVTQRHTDATFFPPEAIAKACATYEMGTPERLLMELFRLGVRPGEMSLLRVNAAGPPGVLMMDGDLLFVGGKRKDYLCLDAVAQQAYKAWVAKRVVPDGAARQDMMFYTILGGTLYRSYMCDVVENAATPETPGLTPQMMRNSRVVELIAQGRDLQWIVEQLGFADVGTVKTYRATYNRSLKKEPVAS